MNWQILIWSSSFKRSEERDSKAKTIYNYIVFILIAGYMVVFMCVRERETEEREMKEIDGYTDKEMETEPVG